MKLGPSRLGEWSPCCPNRRPLARYPESVPMYSKLNCSVKQRSKIWSKYTIAVCRPCTYFGKPSQATYSADLRNEASSLSPRTTALVSSYCTVKRLFSKHYEIEIVTIIPLWKTILLPGILQLEGFVHSNRTSFKGLSFKRREDFTTDRSRWVVPRCGFV